MIKDLYDKTSKISFSTYRDDFLMYFGEYKKIIGELGTEIHTLGGAHKRLDKLVLVDDDTLQNWEFEFRAIKENTLSKIWQYNNLKSAEISKIMDSFIISFANPELCEETIEIGRSIVFAPIIKYLQKMDLPQKLNTIEIKVNNNEKISIEDELTLIFVALSVSDNNKEKIVKRVCRVLDEIDYIDDYRQRVIDSLISFQIENFVKSKNDRDKLNEVVDMKVPVEELFLQVERESVYDEGFERGFDKGKLEGKDETIVNMLAKSFDVETIREVTGCSRKHIFELKNKHK